MWRWCYKYGIRWLLFCCDPEWIHDRALSALDWAGRNRAASALMKWLFRMNDPALAVKAAGVSLPGPVIMPAGFIKDGQAVEGLLYLGYGAVEIGSVSLKPWKGNPAPRIVRLPGFGALVNRMGLNNDGIGLVIRRIANSRAKTSIGISVIPSPDPDNTTDPIEDIAMTVRETIRVADFIVLNLSCPNTKNGRVFQYPDLLKSLLKRLSVEFEQFSYAVPAIWVKVSPELPHEQKARVVQICVDSPLVKALIDGNTATEHQRYGIPKEVSASIQKKIGGTSGLSGRPLFQRTLENIRFVRSLAQGKIDIVACGGISSGEDAWRCICAGASLLQILTGLVYEGPSLIRDINRYLANKVREHGLGSISEVVGREDLAN